MSFFSEIAKSTDQPDSRGMTSSHYSGPEISTRLKDLPYQEGTTRIKEKESQAFTKAVGLGDGSVDQELQESHYSLTSIKNAKGIGGHDEEVLRTSGADTKLGDHSAEEHSPRRFRGRRKRENNESFKASWPWLIGNLDHLLAAGWTKAELFRRGRFRCPLGNWGAAWLDVWSKDGLSVSIGSRGQIVFRFISNNRVIEQSVYPSQSLLM